MSRVAPGKPLGFSRREESRSRGGVVDGIHTTTSPWKENRMHRKISTTLAILATTAGAAALASSAQAQISPTIAVDVVDNDALQVVGDPDITLDDGNVAFQWGRGATSSRLTGTLHLTDADKARWRVRVDSFDRSGTLVGTEYDVANGTPAKKEVKDIPV